MTIKSIASNLIVDPATIQQLPAKALVNQAILRRNIAIGLDGEIRGDGVGEGTQRAEQVGRWYESDGTDDYVRTATEINLTGEYTLSIWAKRDNDSRLEFLLGGTTSNNKFGFTNTGANTYFLRATEGGPSATGDCGVDTTEWTCYTIVRDASDKIDLYVNGNHIGRLFSDVAQSGSCYIQRIGSEETGSDFDGGIKNALVYSRALFPTEIRRLYTHPTQVNVADLELFYDCEDTHPTIAYDRSGNGNNGTKTNTTSSTFHGTSTVQSDCPFSHQNEVGYSDSANGPVPRDESNRTLDVLGNTLDYSGKAPANAQLTKSGCATFDGTDDYVDGDVSQITGYPFTMMARVKPSGGALGTVCAITDRDDGTKYLGFGYDDGDRLYIAYRNGAVVDHTETVAIDSSETHLAVVFVSETRAKFYRNGVLMFDKTDFTSTTFPAGIDAYVVGALRISSPTSFYDGAIWDFRLYDGEKTQAEILAISEGSYDQTNLAVGLPMEEKAGSVHYDVSGNDNHGTINNHTESTYFGSTQDSSHYSRTKGFSKYTHTTTDPIYVPYAASGSVLSITPPTGYTKEDDHPAGAFLNNYPGGEVDLNPNVAPKRNNAVRDNLLSNGRDLGNANWIKVRSTVDDNQIESPRGLIESDKIVEDGTASNTHLVYRAVTLTADSRNTVAFALKAGERTEARLTLADSFGTNGIRVDADLSAGTLSNGTTSGTGWTYEDSTIELIGDHYLVTLTGVAASDTSGYVLINLMSVGATIYNGDSSSGLYATAGKVEEWHEYTGDIDPGRASEDLPHDWEMPVNIQSNVTLSDTGEWTASNTTVTGGQADPDGGTNAYSLVGTGGGTNIVYSAPLGANTTVVGNRYLLSCKIKNIDATSFRIRSLNGTSEADATYTVSTQAVSLAVGEFAWVDDLGDGWLRLNIVYTATITDTRIYLYPNNANNTTGAYFYEPELKRYYENPLFFREITKNGNLHRVDRLMQFKQILVPNRLTHAQTFTVETTV